MDEATAPLRAALRKAYGQHTDPAYVYAIIVAASRITAIGRADIEALSSQRETVYESWGEVIASDLKERGSDLDVHHLNDAGIDYMKSMIKSDGEIWVDSGDKRHQFSDLSQLFMFTDPNYGSR